MKIRYGILPFAFFVMAFFIITGGNVKAQQGVSSPVLHVDLQEWEIVVTEPQFVSGKITFKVSNRGDFVHEMVVIKTRIAADAFKVVDGKVIEDAVGEVMGEVEALAVGGSQDLALVLSEGTYVLFCNNREEDQVKGHYQKGMRIAFQVGNPPA